MMVVHITYPYISHEILTSKMFFCSGQQMNMNIFLRHISNSLALVLDLLIIKHPARFLHFIYPIMFGTFYLMFTVVFTMLGGINK